MAANPRKLADALTKLEQAARKGGTAFAKFEARMDITPDKWKTYGDRAAQQLQFMAVRFLLANYRGSGLRKRTGKLQNAIKSSRLFFSLKGKKAKLVAHMPSGISPYKNEAKKGGGTTSDFYQVAGALHAGAVIVEKRERDVISTQGNEGRGTFKGRRVESIIGEKAKRSLKKKMLTGKISKRAQKAIEQGQKRFGGGTVIAGRNFGVAGKTSDKSVKSVGGQDKVTVIRPKPFYHFNPGQSSKLSGLFLRIVMDMAKQQAGIRSRRAG